MGSIEVRPTWRGTAAVARKVIRGHWGPLLPLVVAVALTVVVTGPVHRAQDEAEARATSEGAQRSLTVWERPAAEGETESEGVRPDLLTEARLAEIAELPGVRTVVAGGSGVGEVYPGAPVGEGEPTDPAMLRVLPWTADLSLRAGDPPGLTEIVLPDGFAGRSAEELLGERLVFRHTPLVWEGDPDGVESGRGNEPVDVELTVAGVHGGPASPAEGEPWGYMTPGIVQMFHLAERPRREQGFESARVEAYGPDRADRLVEELRATGLVVEPVAVELRRLTAPLDVAAVWTRVAPWAVFGLGMFAGLVIGAVRMTAGGGSRGVRDGGSSADRGPRVGAVGVALAGVASAAAGALIGLVIGTVFTGMWSGAAVATAVVLVPWVGMATLLGTGLPWRGTHRPPAPG
ncbi:hypothetical protein GCM10027160_06150 [Streptomyces calidiresistens]|uniref:Uncharacterized protein n=1 Tax=Streptomyces calidiresistens TaxID=1485586 RepID=A0A7W3T4G0_9ACTN|nr:hypothetical protein [Streptomyces calidiresistens]MBB0230779.1 hypothetical protein [Streptomyces calidiresistens]